MRLLGLLIVGVVLGRPALAEGQSVKPADLVGQWALKGEAKPTITFQADSTFVWVRKLTATTQDGQTVKKDLLGRWHLASDTLVTTQPKDRETLQPVDVPGGKTTRRVKLEGRQLTLTDLKDGKDGKSWVFERLDSPKPSK